MKTPSVIKSIQDQFPDAVLASHNYRGDETVVIAKGFLFEISEFLKQDSALKMNLLVDVTAVDYSTFEERPPDAFFTSSGVGVRPVAEIPDEDPWPGPPGGERFAMAYHFYSLEHKHRVRLVVPVAEAAPEVDSIISLWAGADWLEREVWDMFGIRFRGHPNLKRILMYEEFEGHPLRKDYPVNKRQPLIGPTN